ncbi:MAG TPA: sodium/solute symporter [Candidatus Hydrogenedentes bacterium]|nr:sodium/solute symporter [Candidatus Hydrogenedentota bacterium]
MRLGLFDTAVLIAYLFIVALIGFIAGRREKKTARGYFLAGSRLPWYAIGLSMVASSISTEQFIGEVGFAYSHGLAVANWEWAVFPALTVFLWILVPLYIRGRITTMPEYLERRFGVGVRTIFAVLTIISYAIVNMALVLYSGGLALNHIFNIPFMWCVVLLAAVTGAYTIYGGLSSVVWTDAFQCALLLLGGLFIFVRGLWAVDGGLTAILAGGDRAHLILPADHPELPWTAMLTLATSTCIWYYGTNQYINQRVLGAKNEWHAQMGVVFCGFLGVFLALAVSFPGMIAYAMDPLLEDPDTAYPYLVLRLVPKSLQGLLLAALLGAIMSTISSLLNSTATVYTIDIHQRFIRPNASHAQLIRAGRFAALITMLVGVACVPLTSMWKHIFAYCQEVWVLMAGPVVAVFLVGAFWKEATNAAAITVMLLCFPLITLPYLQRTFPFLPGPFANILVLGGLVFVASVILMVAVSLATPARKKTGLDNTIWTKSMLVLPRETAGRRLPLVNSRVFWWVVVGLIYGAIYVYFW